MSKSRWVRGLNPECQMVQKNNDKFYHLNITCFKIDIKIPRKSLPKQFQWCKWCQHQPLQQPPQQQQRSCQRQSLLQH